MDELSDKEEKFCKEFVLNGCESASDAWRKAHPKSKAKPETVHSKASRMLSLGKVETRIRQLRGKVMEKAEEKFNITVEQRLRWLKEITEAGLGTYADASGATRREGLAASKGAIDTMNNMLGTGDGEKSERKSFSVTLKVEDASNPE